MSKDPYRYFRVEARELLDGLARGVLELEKGRAGDDVRPRLLRFAHTLKGAARVVKQPEIAEICHTIEDTLESSEASPMPRADADAVLRLLDTISAKVAALDPPADSEGRAPAPARGDAPASTGDEILSAVRVDVEEMDALLRSASEAAVYVAALREEIRRIAPGLIELVGRAEAEIEAIRDRLSRLRLVPARAVFDTLERAIRDAAGVTGRAVSFRTEGGDTRLDAHVLAALRGALLHIVRNAVVHGGAPEAERLAAGKPPLLAVSLAVERRDGRIAFVCADDGGGIDVDAVRQAAVRRGTISASAASAMGEGDVIKLVLEGGLTTASSVTQVAGRGVGLDVVRETAARLKGEVSVRSERGRGTTVEVRVPVSLSSLATLRVDTGGLVASIPLDAVRRTVHVLPHEIARTADRESILHEGGPIPFFPLARALGAGPGRRRDPRAATPAVVVQAGGAVAAVGVDRVVGATRVVMRALPAIVAAEPVVMGAALDAQGDPELVLDPAELARAARTAKAHEPPAPIAPARPVLIVDDSLTTRMLEQSILESAGYEVELCSSAEEALVAAGAKRYGLFVVDVEMPGMDGFEFVARTRADPTLRDTPAILVTSCASPEDRRRGERAGARGYIVKGEFDQARLLEIVRELVA